VTDWNELIEEEFGKVHLYVGVMDDGINKIMTISVRKLREFSAEYYPYPEEEEEE